MKKIKIDVQKLTNSNYQTLTSRNTTKSAKKRKNNKEKKKDIDMVVMTGIRVAISSKQTKLSPKNEFTNQIQ